MILALDIGNSNIKAALFEGLEQKTYFRISCDRNKSSDEYGVAPEYAAPRRLQP